MLGVGFEPTHLAILELESSALDHSAIQASTGLAAESDVQVRVRQEGKNEGRRFGKTPLPGASGLRSLYLPLAKRALYQLS